ncbi:MAG: hypothetical protein WCL21_09920 [Mariniphaga sp.]
MKNKVGISIFYPFLLGFSLIPFFNCTFAQDARVVTFKHTIRWLNESQFPNYFLIPEVRDSINGHFKKIILLKFKVSNVSFPDKVDYRNITGFGKPKNISSEPSLPADYNIDVFSLLSRAVTGYALSWSVRIVVRKEGKIIYEKEAMHELEYAYDIMASQHWLSPQEFTKILSALILEAVSPESDKTGIITVGPSIQEKETDISLRLSKSARYLLKTNGPWLSAGNISSLLVNEKDTILKFKYSNKIDFSMGGLSLKPGLAKLFTDATGIGTNYTVKEKERKRGVIKFSGGTQLLIQLDWINEITSSTNSDEVRSKISGALVGQLFNDSTLAGSFVYEKLSKMLSPDERKEKLRLASSVSAVNSFENVVIHRIKATLESKLFTAEYNESDGLLEIKSDNQTLAIMILHNCNPEIIRTKMKTNPALLNGIPAGDDYSNASHAPKSEGNLKWYPFFMKESASKEEMTKSMEMLVCLFFGMEYM